MTEELKMKLAKLRTLAPELNKATDEATAVVQAVERMLGPELSLGISADVCFDTWPAEGYEREGDDEHRLDEVPTVFAVLVYGRVDGRFCLHVLEETRREGTNDRGHPTYFTLAVERTPWSSCPRDVKLKSFAALPDLLGEICDEVENLTAESVKTSKAARDLIEAMGASPGAETLAPAAPRTDANGQAPTPPISARGRRRQ